METELIPSHVGKFFECFRMRSEYQFGLAQNNLFAQVISKIQFFVAGTLGLVTGFTPYLAILIFIGRRFSVR
jgi:hypothetical protein